MTIVNEKNGVSLISNASDREGDTITVYELDGVTADFGSGDITIKTVGSTAIKCTQLGIVYLDQADADDNPADGNSNASFATFTYKLWDGTDVGALRTATIALNGVATPGAATYVQTGLVMLLDPDAGVTGSAPVTAWADQVGAKSFTAIGTPSLGTPPGGTASNTIVAAAGDDGFTCADLTNFPTSGADRTVQMIWKQTGGFGYAGFGYGSGSASGAFSLTADGNDELAIDIYGSRTLAGVAPLNQWNVLTARLANGVLTIFVGGAKIYSDDASLATGADLINICRTFSGHTTYAAIGDILVYGRALADAEILSNVAALNGRFIGDTTVTAPGTPTGSNVAAASFTVGGTVAENWGFVLWAVKAGTGTMTEQEIIDGTGALSHGVAPINNASTWAANVTGATAASDYRAHAIFYDLVGGKSSVVSSATITTTGADSTAPTLTSPLGNAGTSTTAATVSVSTDEGNGDAVWGVYLATATVPTRAQLRAGTDGDGAPLVATGTVTVTASGTLQATATGLTANTNYQVAWQHDDAAGNQSAISESANFPTAASAGTIPEQVDGLYLGTEPVGRTSVASLKGVGALPAGVDLNGNTIQFTADNVTLEDFDLTAGYQINFNNRTGCTLRQCLLNSNGVNGHFIIIPAGSHNTTIEYNDIAGEGSGGGQDNSLIQQIKTSTNPSATCATGCVIRRNKLYGMAADGMHLTGGGILVEWNLIDLPSQCAQDLQLYDGIPGNWTTGDCVAFEDGGNELWYVNVCKVTTPTLDPTRQPGGNADWNRPPPHTDYFNARASIGAGITIQYNFTNDDWPNQLADGIRVVNVNNIGRWVRNNNDTAPVNEITYRGNKNNRHNTLASFPFQCSGAADVVGPYNFIDNRMGAKASGNYVNGGSAKIGTWSGNTDAWTGAPIAQP